MSTATQPNNDSTRQLVAQNFSNALKANRWSERKAAEALGLTPAYVNRRASGETEMSASDLAMFASFLGLKEQDFFKITRAGGTRFYGAGGSNVVPFIGSRVGPTGLEPMTSTVEDPDFERPLAIVSPIRQAS